MSHQDAQAVPLFPQIQEQCEQFLSSGPSERKAQIQAGADFIISRLATNGTAELMFICTHNSRRSQFAHVWATVAAAVHGLDAVNCFSGGTEVTACNPRTIASLKRSGFQIESSSAGPNPKYLVHFAENLAPAECDSKLFTDPGLHEFAAMMCCSDVDEKCPIVPQATIRIPWHYEDPKIADDTAEEAARYDERSLQIGRDMFQMMSLVKRGG